MKKVTIILTGVILMSIASLNVNAQSEATASSVDASATIISPLAIENNTALQFGRIITDADGGTVVLTAAETAVVTYPDLPNQISTGTKTAAKFTVTGDPAALYSISLPADVTITEPGESKTMTIDNLNASGGIENRVLTGGTQVFYVGATLNVGVTQKAGTYVGTFDVTVAYE